ncbi:uncharacterized protein LOC108736696 isoform X2 [Agrilus planipennis]|uniref:Uncharacterized protein LOC108736696 isoform X2 n=1 Tax=Agrilus planipennis TaxID=224129 RepID=A0A1W4WLB6_AGRPL|nr:uncharacterized protein LOC108736696 isoform X2 [Agrilus planipennis]
MTTKGLRTKYFYYFGQECTFGLHGNCGEIQPLKEKQSFKDERFTDNSRLSLYSVDSVSFQEHQSSSDEYQARPVRTTIRKDSVDSSSSAPDFSVENLLLKSQLETLQWQLKQTEESRQMYQAVMKQVVAFLERAHRSLEHLGTRLINNGKQNVVRSLSQHEVSASSEEQHQPQDALEKSNKDHTAYRDFTWRRRKKEQASPEEIPPEKLSQEAFRLLRTAESLLNTREPDLVHLATITTNRSPSPATSAHHYDSSFSSPEKHFQRPPFAASSPQLACSEGSLSRKAVLRRQHALKCNSFHAETLSNKSSDSHDFDPKDFVFANEIRTNSSRRASISSQRSSAINVKKRTEPETSVTPPMSSVSSAEDESGFSSMNSFQELGIPVVSYEEVGNKSKEALLRSMLHDNNTRQNSNQKKPSQEDRKLWQTPDNSCMHKRWNSSPVEGKVEMNKPLKVLWV